MIYTDGLNFIIRSRRCRAKGTPGNFRGLIKWVLLNKSIRNVDPQKLGFASYGGGCTNRTGSDFTVERPNRHKRVNRLIARHIRNLVGTKLNDTDLVAVSYTHLRAHETRHDL